MKQKWAVSKKNDPLNYGNVGYTSTLGNNRSTPVLITILNVIGQPTQAAHIQIHQLLLLLRWRGRWVLRATASFTFKGSLPEKRIGFSSMLQSTRNIKVKSSYIYDI